MKSVKFFPVIFLFLTAAFPQNRDSVGSLVNDGWRNSLYVSAGYGYPNALRTEFGYNFKKGLSLGINFGIKDYWSGNNYLWGFTAKWHVTDLDTKSVYLMTAFGTNGSHTGNDFYFIFFLGCKIPLTRCLQLCPEIGPIFTSEFNSSNWDLLKFMEGNGFGVKRENRWRVGFNLSFEIEFRSLF